MSASDPTSHSVIVIGGSGAGKTALIHAWLRDVFQEDTVQTIYETYKTRIRYDGRAMDVQLSDTSGLHDNKMRAFSYAGQELVLLAFSLVDEGTNASMDAVSSEWLPEIHHYLPHSIPIILVGCKSDLRNPVDRKHSLTQTQIAENDQGAKIAKLIGAQAYLECSAKTREGVKKVFEAVARTLLGHAVDTREVESELQIEKPQPLVAALDQNPPTKISSGMPVTEILKHLGDHGCEDITGQLNLSESSQYPVSTGGFGDVFRGSLYDGTRVSIKCLRLPDIHSSEEGRKDLKRAARELYIWSGCKHPNILELNGVALYRDQLAMISPWMENGNVSHFLSQNPQFDRYQLCTQIATGVAYLHNEGIAHGDIKGANILISMDLNVKLADFGNSMPILGKNSLLFTTTTNSPGMSLRWTPPEILQEKTRFTFPGDVYSLAMTFLEIITGSVPYIGHGEWATMSRILKKIHPDRPEKEIPSNNPRADTLWCLFKDCWTYDPEHRPTAAGVQKVMMNISEA